MSSSDGAGDVAALLTELRDQNATTLALVKQLADRVSVLEEQLAAPAATAAKHAGPARGNCGQSPSSGGSGSGAAPPRARPRSAGSGDSGRRPGSADSDDVVGISYRPCRGRVYPPSNARTRGPEKEAPHELALQYVHGFRGRDARNAVFFTATNEVVYYTAALGVVLRIRDNSQRFFDDHTDDIVSIALHPEGKLVATGQEGKRPFVLVWDVETLDTVATLRGQHERAVAAVSFSTDGRLLATMGRDNHNTVVVYDWASGKVVASTKTSQDKMFVVSFRSPTEFVATGVKYVKLFQVVAGGKGADALSSRKCLFGKKGNSQPVLDVAHHQTKPDISFTGQLDGSVYVWDGPGIKAVYAHAHKGPIYGVYCDSLGLITVGKDCHVQLWDVQPDGLLKSRRVVDLSDPAYGAALRTVARRATQVLVGTQGNSVLVFDEKTNVVLKLTQSPGLECWGLAPHPSKPRYAVGGDDGIVRMYDADGRVQVDQAGVDSPVRVVAISPDAQHIACGRHDGAVDVREVDALRTPVARLEGVHSQPITALAYSPDSQRLAVGCNDLSISIWTRDPSDPLVYQQSAALRGFSGGVRQIDWASDSRAIQATSGAYEYLMFDAVAGKQIVSLASMRDASWADWTSILGWPVMGIWGSTSDGTDINAVHRSSDGSMLVGADDFGKVRAWAFPCSSRNAVRKEYVGHSAHVTNVRFVFQDRFVVSVGGNDRSVFQWSIDDL